MKKYLLLLLLISCYGTFAQQSSDTLSPSVRTFLPNPNRALLFATLLPGSGQIYNKQPWKLPVVVGVAITIGYYIDYYHNLYSYVGTAYRYETDQDPSTLNPFPNLTATTLRYNLVRLRRDRDMFLILAGVAYLLQATEAYVAAHLLSFDNDMDLSIRGLPFLHGKQRKEL